MGQSFREIAEAASASIIMTDFFNVATPDGDPVPVTSPASVLAMTSALFRARAALVAARRHARNEDCAGCIGLIDEALTHLYGRGAR